MPVPKPTDRVQTSMVHGSTEARSRDFSRSLTLPISSTTAYELGTVERGAAGFQSFATGQKQEPTTYIYQRLDDPCVAALEERLALAEGGEMAVCFASGMAAVSAALGVLLSAGDHILCHRTLYGCTHSLVSRWLGRQGIECSFVDLRDEAALKAAIRPNTRVVYFETPCNPTLDIVDIQAVVGSAKRHGLKTVLDNTFSTPAGQRALGLGIDMVVHSLTKGISGFGTEMGGAVVGSGAHELDLRIYRKDFGGNLAPQTAWHILTYGLPTLRMRFDHQQRNAMAVAQFLFDSPSIENVRYPGLPGFPDRHVAERQMRDYEGTFSPGTLLTFELAEEPSLARERAVALMDAIALRARSIALAVSLGQTRTLIEHPASMTHSALSEAELHRAGISPGLIRLSLGIEDQEDLVGDLAFALEEIHHAPVMSS